MPGLGEDSAEPTPDMGEEVNEKTEVTDASETADS